MVHSTSTASSLLAENAAIKAKNKTLEDAIASLENQLRQSRMSRIKLSIGNAKPAKRSRNDTLCRVIIPDSHGCFIDEKAASSMLQDIKVLKPQSIIMLGDHIDCGGFLAEHHTLGFVAEADYSFEDDCNATNQFLDQLQKAAPNATIEYLEGNHERRIEKWIVTQTRRHQKDAKHLHDRYSTSAVLFLEKRCVKFWSQGAFHEGLSIPATIKRDGCYFTHGEFTSKNAAMAHLNKYNANIWYGHCFSDDTEVLTERGWKFFNELLIGENVMTVNLDNANCELQPVRDVVVYGNYTELMQFKAGSVDALVTDEHAMVTTSRHGSFMHEERPRTTLNRVMAKDLAEIKAFTIPCSGLNNQKDYPIADDMLKFCVWMWSEGTNSTAPGRNKSGYGDNLSIAQSDNPEKGGMVELVGILDRLGVNYSKKKRYEKCTVGHGQWRNYDAYIFRLAKHDPICKEYLRLSPTKQIQPWVMNLSARQSRIVLDTLILTDGCWNKAATRSGQFASNKKEDMDLFQSLCATNGWKCSVIDRERRGAQYFCATVNLSGRQHFSTSRPEMVPYSGNVWCCSVDNKTLIVRRNGKSFVCGNTHRADMAMKRTVKDGAIGAWNPGVLCRLQPLWMMTNLTDWTHGYGIQVVRQGLGHLNLQIPIIDGVSYLSPLLDFGSKR